MKLGLFVNTDMYFINKIMDYNANPNNHAYIEVYTICEENVSFFPEKAQISFKRQSAEAVAEEMYQGTGPDLLVGFSDLYEFNNEQFLRDLKPYLDADTTIKKEDYFSNIFSSFETDEKLYSMPLTYTLKGMAVNSKVSGAKEKMTFEDLSKAAASLPAGMNLLPDYSCSDLFMQFLSVSMKDFVDYEKGEAYLDSDNFKAALEAAKSIGKADPTTAKGISVYDTNTLVKQEEQFFTGAYGAKKVSISDLENYCLLRNTKDGDKTVFTGYLSLDGKSMTASSELTMSITSCASDPDLAWEFIRYMLGTDAQQYMASNMDTLPVNKSAFDAISQEQIALSKEVHDHYLEDPEAFSSEPIAITSEQKDELSKLISSVDNTAHIDSEIQAAIFDEVDRYFNDYVTLDEFCKAIQAKASEIMKNR